MNENAPSQNDTPPKLESISDILENTKLRLDLSNDITQSQLGISPNFIQSLSEQEIRGIYNLLMEDNFLDKWVASLTPGGKIHDYQKIMLAPANAFIDFISNSISFDTKEEESNFMKGMDSIPNLFSLIEKLIDIFKSRLTSQEKAAFMLRIGVHTALRGAIIERFLRALKLLGMRKGAFGKVAWKVQAGIQKHRVAIASTAAVYSTVENIGEISNAIEKP